MRIDPIDLEIRHYREGGIDPYNYKRFQSAVEFVFHEGEGEFQRGKTTHPYYVFKSTRVILRFIDQGKWQDKTCFVLKKEEERK